MGTGKIKHMIVYSSPAGTTRHVAQVVEKKLKELGCEVEIYDLGNRDDCSRLNTTIKDKLNNCCLWIGSPVYAGHAVPPIMHIISKLQAGSGNSAIPFVTWGAVTSGIALGEMGEMLAEKGYAVLGAAKIVAVHSMMWECDEPLGKGHPDNMDDKMMEELVEKVHSKLQGESTDALSLEVLKYQPEQVQEMLQKINMEVAKEMLPPLNLDEDTCTQCALCENECPVFAITLDPYPRFGDDCIRCYNCLRLCEEGAIKSDLSGVEPMLKEKAADRPEFPQSQVFV